MKSRKSYCTTTGVSLCGGIDISRMLKFYVKVFYVMGKTLSGELSCPCNRSCLLKLKSIVNSYVLPLGPNPSKQGSGLEENSSFHKEYSFMEEGGEKENGRIHFPESVFISPKSG